MTIPNKKFFVSRHPLKIAVAGVLANARFELGPEKDSTDSDFRQENDISTENDMSMSSELCDSRHRHNAALV
jgi:hypothetical protein